MNDICSAEFGFAMRRGFALAVVKPALKRGATLDCRYRGKGAAARRISAGAAANPVGDVRFAYRSMKSNTFSQKEGCTCTRFNAVRYACLHPASGNHSSALADYDRSPAIHRRVWVEMNVSSRSDG